MSSKFAGMGLSVEKPFRMPLVHPSTRQPLRDPEGTEGWIELFSTDSDIARKHQLVVQRRRLRNARGRLRIEPEELEADTIDLLSALTAGWHLVTPEGNLVDCPFSPENAREFYTDPAHAWAREQVDEFVSDRGNFLPGSSPT